MTRYSTLIRPIPQTSHSYEAVLATLIHHCSTCPYILALIRHGSFPGDLGISDIDVIVVIDEDKPIEISFLQKLKRLSYLLDIVFLPSSLLPELSNNFSLSNPSVLYTFDNDNESIYTLLNNYIPSSVVLYSESISAYLHKYACLIRISSCRALDLRKLLLCAKSTLRSIEFIGFHERYEDLFNVCKALHGHLRTNNSFLTDPEILCLVNEFMNLIYKLHPHIVSQYNDYFSSLFPTSNFVLFGPRMRGIRLLRSPSILIYIVSKLNFLRQISTKLFFLLPSSIILYANYISIYCSRLTENPTSNDEFKKHIYYIYTLYYKQRKLGLPISFHSISRFLP